MRMPSLAIAYLALFLASSAIAQTTVAAVPAKTISYPTSKTVEHMDEYHGTKVADPFRWLEDDVRTSDEVAKWVADQNKVTDAFLDSIPEREEIEKRLTKLWDYPRASAPHKVAGTYFFYKNDGLQNQSVLYKSATLNGEHSVVIDPNQWSEDGTVALGGTSASDNGRYLAYGKQSAGSDWRTWHVLDLKTGKDLPDVLNWVKFSGISWTNDNKGFYYGRYDEQTGDKQFIKKNENQKLYYHLLGEPQASDKLIYERPDHPLWKFSGEVTEDGRYLVITISRGTARKYQVLVQDLEKPDSKPITLVDHFNDQYNFLGNDGRKFYFQTDLNASNGRVIAIDLDHIEPENYVEIIPESEHPLRGISMVGDTFVVNRMQDVCSRVTVYDTNGKELHKVALPKFGSISGTGGRRDDNETFFMYSSYDTPSTIHRYDVATNELSVYRKSQVTFDSSKYEVKQVFYKSKDGTRVPMFITHRKGLKLDGNNPTLLYAYGGFKISTTPSFRLSRAMWLEMGGVYAVANLRGGGEYGQSWHEGGMQKNKQNGFDDFIAAAEWLVDKKYTNSKKLAIQGGSNGGLLVGAVMTQRPELFGACLPAVGVMDMLRFHKFTIGYAWVDEYGSSDDAEMFPILYGYSPYHNLKDGTAYPPTMVMTADTDDRVVPGHSFKFAARLQQAHSGDAPTLIRIESSAGHGSGKPSSKAIHETADVLAFLVRTLKMENVFGK